MSADDPRQKLLSILDPLVEDILSMSDEDVLAEAREEGLDLDAASAEVATVLAAAQAAAGRARLAAARAQVDGVRSFRSRSSITGLSASEKEIILRRFSANDNPLQERLTMAARNGQSLTEQEVDTVLLDLVELGALDDQGNIR